VLKLLATVPKARIFAGEANIYLSKQFSQLQNGLVRFARPEDTDVVVIVTKRSPRTPPVATRIAILVLVRYE
jgi:hypothetical protein